jgi:SAM-dependent methyltransferase
VSADGKSCQSREGEPAFTLVFRNRRAERRILVFGHVGLLESYFAGDLDVEASLQLAFRTGMDMGLDKPPTGLLKLHNAWHEFRFGNASIAQAKANARFHYGLGADFYRLWLDQASMMYTCGYWKEGTHSVEEAQKNKMDHVARKIRLQPGERFVDIGCGFGVDAWWMAGQGIRSTGLDRSPVAYAGLEARGAEEGLDLRFLTLNLLELRSVLSAGALVAARPGPRVVAARHLVDAVDARARANLWRLVAMALRDGGSLHLEFLVRRGSDKYAAREHVKVRSAGLIARELVAAGATIEHRETLLASAAGSPGQPGTDPSKICRMVATWAR